MKIVIASLLLSLAFFLESVESADVNVDSNNNFHIERLRPGSFRLNRQNSKFDSVSPRSPLDPRKIENYNPNRELYPLPSPPQRTVQGSSTADNKHNPVEKYNSPARHHRKSNSKSGFLCCGGF